jgi:hypothetical protein
MWPVKKTMNKTMKLLTWIHNKKKCEGWGKDTTSTTKHQREVHHHTYVVFVTENPLKDDAAADV